LKSRPTDEIIEEFTAGRARGYRVFQLISEDTGCYGLDIGTTLPGLLQRIFNHAGTCQLIIIDYHPRWIIHQYAQMVPLLVKHQEKVKEIFIPIQSGSNRILHAMKRDHSAEQLLPILKELNENAPRIGLRTSVLVGFPGETREDFELTVDFIRKVRFTEVTVNRYEDRPRTLSSAMNEKVAQETIEKRARFLADSLGCNILS
jgi:tRNA A37 methylthiotransferase MiaB